MSSHQQVEPVSRNGYVAKRNVVSTLAGGAFVALSLWAALGALLVAGMTCGDTCAGTQPPPKADWTQYSDAAQWSQIGLLGAASLAIAVATTVLVAVGRRGAAGVLVLLFMVASLPLAAMVDHAHPSSTWWVWLLASVLGVLTALAARPR